MIPPHFQALKPVRLVYCTVGRCWAAVRRKDDWEATKWNWIVFSDESRFILESDDNRVRVWRLRGEHFNPAFGLQRYIVLRSGVIACAVITYDTQPSLILIDSFSMQLSIQEQKSQDESSRYKLV